MAKPVNWLRRLPTQRRLVQLYAALLYNAHVRGFISGEIYVGNAKLLCVPGLNCYSCPGAVGACPLGALQNALSASGHRAPYYILGILLLYAVLLGRTVCGWLCPVGLVQELLHKLPGPKLKKGRLTRGLSWLKYIVLAAFVVAVPVYFAFRSFPLPAFCKYICPAGTLEGAVGLLIHPNNRELVPLLGGLFTWKMAVLVALMVLCVFVYRAFCRFICPLGAIYGLFAKVAIVGVKVEAAKCVDCGKCLGCCPMDIRQVGDRECISCGKCIPHCPTGAISMKAGKLVLIEKDTPEEKLASRRKKAAAAWVLALAVLAGAFWYFNRPEKQPENPTQELSVGGEVGMLAPEIILPLYGGGDFAVSEQAGKTVVLNFWATWCSPCVAELPCFDEIHRNYGESVAVVAVHSHLVTEDVEAYLQKFDYAMPFALDESGEAIAAFGGSNTLPHTVIIGPDGIVQYNAVGAMSYERLEELISD